MATKPNTLNTDKATYDKVYDLYGADKVNKALGNYTKSGGTVNVSSTPKPTSTGVKTGGSAPGSGQGTSGTRIVRNADGTTTTTGGTTSTGAVEGSVGSVLGDGTLSAYEQALQDEANRNKALGEGVVDEEAIRAQALAARQAQLDATTQVYADQLNRARVAGQGRIGTGTAMQSRSGLLGSDFGAAQSNTIEGYNQEIYSAIDAEKNAALQAIISEGRNDATAEIAAKRAAKEAGGAAYLEYLRGATERKSTKTANAAKKLLALGQDPNSMSEADIKKAGYDRDDLIIAYNELKAQQDAATATAQAASEKSGLENAKTQAEINKINADASRNYEEGGYIYNSNGEVIAQVVGKNYEAGGKIYEAGTNKYLGDARSVTGGGGGGTVGGGGGTVGGGGTANAGNIVTRKLNNGQNITTGSNVADGLNIAGATIPGIRFDTQNAYRTADDQAKLYGKGRTAAELQAAGVNPAYAQPGQSRVTWTLNSNHMSGNAVDVVGDKNYLDSIEAAMNAAGFVRPEETMAKGDYGHFEYQGSGNSTASSKGGKQISTTVATNLSDAKYFPTLLSDLETLISSNKDMFDPIKGLYYAANPYETGAQSVEDDLRRAAQLVGKFMEGGVLRAEDEKKYAKMLPKLTDSFNVAQNKLEGVRKMLADKYNGYLTDYANSGYDVSNFMQVSTGSSAPQNVSNSNVSDDDYAKALALINE